MFAEFLDDGFNKEEQLLDFEVLELSPASITILKRKLVTLLREINELSKIDYSLAQGTKQSIGILLAVRPWVYSLAIDAMTADYQKERAN